MDRQSLIDAYPLAELMERDGITLIGNGNERSALCFLHPDRRPSMSVNLSKQTWYCQRCDRGGSVIDYISERTGRTIEDVMAELAAELPNQTSKQPARRGAKIAAEYIYRNAVGEEVFKVIRYDPKDFRQQKKVRNGWEWGMDQTERVLYRLPELLQSQDKPIWIVEGEKDADNLMRFGQIATCNVGGAGKWMDGYTTTLTGRDVIICGDNDDAGVMHVKKIIEAMDGKAKRLRVVTMAAPFKDISDWLAQFGGLDAGASALNELLEKATVMVQGGTVPILSMAEMEERYKSFVIDIDKLGYSFNNWLPSLGRRVRTMVPGDIITFVCGTGGGKTALIQNMFWRAAPLPSLLFEMELADTLTFERFVAGAMRVRCDEVEDAYKNNQPIDWRETGRLNNIYVCPLSGLKVSRIEEIINRAELKMGVRPRLVGIDYAQLLNGVGKDRYARVTDAMSDLKSMAKNTQTILVVASQIQRKNPDEDPEVGLYAGKDSGQIENSSGLQVGFWRDKNDATLLYGQVNKNTKGQSGFRFQMNFDGARMIITERANSNN